MSPTSTDEDVAEEEEEEEEEPAEQDAVSFLFSVKRKASIGWYKTVSLYTSIGVLKRTFLKINDQKSPFRYLLLDVFVISSWVLHGWSL